MKWQLRRATPLATVAFLLFVFFVPVPASAATTYYVATNGSDSATGTQAAPWSSIAHAETVVAPGDTVYIRAGKYAYTSGTKTCASGTDNISGIALSKSGTPGNPIHYWAFPGEVPLFDFSGIRDSCRVKGFLVSGSWIHLKGLEITGVPQNNNLNHESWGVWISGSNNVFEMLNIHHIMGTGLFIQNGGGNLVLNCDSHHNYDPLTSNGAGQSGDGFGCHIPAGNTGNVFRGCRAWMNSDDGYDVINAFESVTIEGSWAWQMGYLPGTLTALPAGNGNGFKSGGYGADPTKFPVTPARHVIRNNVAFITKAAGFYANHHPVSSFFYNNTSFDNGTDFNMLGMDASGGATTVGVYRNNIAFSHSGGRLLSNDTNSAADDANNSWTLPITVTDAQFQSVSYVGMDGPRQADGSLPCLGFLRLQPTSDFVGKGQDVGIPFRGAAPDLGAFPVGACGTGSSGSSDAGPMVGVDSSSSGGSDASSSGSSGMASGGSTSGSGLNEPLDATRDGPASAVGGDLEAGSDAGGRDAAPNADAKSGGCGCEAIGAVPSSRFEAMAAAALVAAIGAWRRRRTACDRRGERGKRVVSR